MNIVDSLYSHTVINLHSGNMKKQKAEFESAEKDIKMMKDNDN